MYDDFDGSRRDVEDKIREFGQLPLRLFGSPHPVRRERASGSFLTSPVTIENDTTVEVASFALVDGGLVCTCGTRKSLQHPDDSHPRHLRAWTLPVVAGAI
jgi:hypothetical protein